MAGGILPDPASGSPLAGRMPGRVAIAALPVDTDPTRVPRVLSAERACAFAHVADIAAAIRTSKIRSLLRALSIGCRSLPQLRVGRLNTRDPVHGRSDPAKAFVAPRGPASTPLLVSS